MAMKSRDQAVALVDNPLEGEQLFLDAMLGGGTKSAELKHGAPRRPQAVKRQPEQKPQHYKIVSISLYVEDIQRLDGMVTELKKRGHHKANKSQLIRYALSQVNLDDVPKEY